MARKAVGRRSVLKGGVAAVGVFGSGAATALIGTAEPAHAQMPRHNYKVELRWTSWGLDPCNPETQQMRIQLAADTATRHSVKGPNDAPLDTTNDNHRHDHGDGLHIDLARAWNT